MSFVYVDAEKYGSYGTSLGLTDNWPGLVTLLPVKGWKFPFDKSAGFTTEALEHYFSEIVEGKITPSVKSAAVPETNDEPVKIVVGSTFNDIVLNESNDVLLEIYAPWCGHCKKLTPVYTELAKFLAPVSTITIAKMDGTENDLPLDSPYQIEGFPTIKLYKAKDNKIVDFEGSRDLEGMLLFLKAHAVHGADIPESKPTIKEGEEEENDALAAEEHEEL